MIDAFKSKYTQASGQLTLIEKSKNSKYRKCTLKNCGKCILLETDHKDLDWLKILKDHKGIKSRCDYVLLYKLPNDKLAAIFFEMKGKNSEHAKVQLLNTYKYFAYLNELLKINKKLSGKLTSLGVILGSSIKSNVKPSSPKKVVDIDGLNIYFLPQLELLDIKKLLEEARLFKRC